VNTQYPSPLGVAEILTAVSLINLDERVDRRRVARPEGSFAGLSFGAGQVAIIRT